VSHTCGHHPNLENVGDSKATKRCLGAQKETRKRKANTPFPSELVDPRMDGVGKMMRPLVGKGG